MPFSKCPVAFFQFQFESYKCWYSFKFFWNKNLKTSMRKNKFLNAKQALWWVNDFLFLLTCHLTRKNCKVCAWSLPRTTDAQWSLFSLKSRTFGLGQTNWADKFWGIWGIFGQTISTHFGTVSPLSMFFIIQPLFLQKTKSLYPHPK